MTKKINELNQPKMTAEESIKFLENLRQEINDHMEKMQPDFDILCQEYKEFLKGQNNENI